MLIRYIVTAILAAASYFLTFQVTKSIAIHFFDEIFVKVTNFETCDFDSSHNFDSSYNFDLLEDFSSAFQSVHSSESVVTPDADTSNFSSSNTCPLPLASASLDPEPTKPVTSAATGHSGSIVGIGVVFLVSLSLRTFWFMRRHPPPRPPPPLPPDLPYGNPPTPDPPPYLNPKQLWPGTWICNFSCACPSPSSTTQAPARSRSSQSSQSSRLRYFPSHPPIFPEEELGWDGELFL